jgi:hypothetical protein
MRRYARWPWAGDPRAPSRAIGGRASSRVGAVTAVGVVRQQRPVGHAAKQLSTYGAPCSAPATNIS